MSTVSLTLPVSEEDSQVGAVSRATTGYWTQSDVQTRIGLSTEGGVGTLWLPYAPREVTYEGFGSDWQEQPRDGNRKPLLVPAAKKLKKMSFTVELVRPEWDEPVQAVLDRLNNFTVTNSRILVSYSAWENGFWRLTNMRVSTTMRSDRDNSITRCKVDLDFTEASDAVRSISPVTGGTTPTASTAASSGTKSSVPAYYITKKGDTLHSIAIKFYRNHKMWKKIAKKNKIKYVKQKFKAGRRLKLP